MNTENTPPDAFRPPPQTPAFPPYFPVIIGVAIAVQCVVPYWLGVYWGMCTPPLLFAAYGAFRLHDLDRVNDFRLKRILTMLSAACLGAAWAYQAYLASLPKG